MVQCPICDKAVREANINRHIDSGCADLIDLPSPPATQQPPRSSQVASFFKTPAKKDAISQSQPANAAWPTNDLKPATPSAESSKRPLELEDSLLSTNGDDSGPKAKKTKTNAFDKVAPLAERMRPRTLDDVHGQELVGPNGVLRNLIESDRVPSMVLWGGPGTGKTTIARLIAQTSGSRFVEINSTASGVGECKRLFQEAKNELSLTGRRTIIFCDEIHRFSKSQQDVFLGPVEAGTVVLIGATTENPSFKVISALLSRCRTFTLAKLTDDDIFSILKRALVIEPPSNDHSKTLLGNDNHSLLHYLASFSDGDARTALNLLSLALDLSAQSTTTTPSLKASLTQTLVYDRAGDQHYDTISALHKSIRGSDPNATLYYLARMLQSGEDALFIARRLVVIASEDIGLADNTMLSLATAAYTAAEKIGMPECRINLAHCAVALALAPKSTRSYRGLKAAIEALKESGVAGLAIPLHVRNAPTGLLRDLGYAVGYKYNPDFEGGRVVQEYLPEKLVGRKFLEDGDLGTVVDPDVVEKDRRLREREEEVRGLMGKGRHAAQRAKRELAGDAEPGVTGKDVDGEQACEDDENLRNGAEDEPDELIMNEDDELFFNSDGG